MKNHRTSRASMILTMHGKKVNCVFTTFNSPFYLHLAAIGRNDLSIEFDVIKSFYLKSEYVNNLSEWCKYFGLKYNPNNHYSGTAFLDEVEREINNSNPIYQHNYSERIQGISKSSDKEGFIFCGTYNNPDGKHVTSENHEKTKRAFGKSVADHFRKANISSKWTTNSNDENLDYIINNFPNLQF